MPKSIDPLRLIGYLSAFCGLTLTVIRVVKELREGIETIGLGQKESPSLFYELCFWGVVSALIGGFIWGLFWRQSIGDTGNEPHGVWAILWPFITNMPGILALTALNWKYHFVSWKEQFLSFVAWLTGAMIGSWAFYDIPLKSYYGFREFFLNSSVELEEFWLVIIWSAMVAFPAFLFLAVFRWRRIGIPPGLKNLWSGVVRPSGLTVIVTTLIVGGFFLVYPDQSKFGQARGVLAGLSLRIMLFVSLFLALPVVGQNVSATISNGEPSTEHGAAVDADKPRN